MNAVLLVWQFFAKAMKNSRGVGDVKGPARKVLCGYILSAPTQEEVSAATKRKLYQGDVHVERYSMMSTSSTFNTTT